MTMPPVSHLIPAQVTEAVGAVAPITGMAFGDLDDKSTWACSFKDEATDAQRLAAQAVIDAYVPKAPVPDVISDRQFFQQLAVLGIITTDEALAAVGPGDIPAALDALIAQLPPDKQFAARMLLSGATQFDRKHPLVAVFASAFEWNADQIDAFWTAASAL